MSKKIPDGRRWQSIPCVLKEEDRQPFRFSRQSLHAACVAFGVEDQWPDVSETLDHWERKTELNNWEI